MSRIDPEEARKNFEAGKAVIVDVREPDEVAAMSVPGALHIPLDKLEGRLGEITDGEVYFLCRSGARASMACDKVGSRFPGAKSIEGGLLAWEKTGGPVTVKSRVIPLMRQVQIAAGLLILSGFFVKQLWILVPFVGAGLTVAGLTGFCGMARVLQLMPWNRSSKGGAACPR